MVEAFKSVCGISFIRNISELCDLNLRKFQSMHAPSSTSGAGAPPSVVAMSKANAHVDNASGGDDELSDDGKEEEGAGDGDGDDDGDDGGGKGLDGKEGIEEEKVILAGEDNGNNEQGMEAR